MQTTLNREERRIVIEALKEYQDSLLKTNTFYWASKACDILKAIEDNDAKIILKQSA